MNEQEIEAQIRRGLTVITERVRLAKEGAARVDARLLALPRHMAVEPEVFELITLMMGDVTEALGKLDGSLVQKSGVFQFTAASEKLSGALRIALLARAEQKLKHCEELIVSALKMVDGEMDVWGRAITHSASWGK